MIEFKFLPQTKSVELLLQACWHAMPHLPEPEKAVMTQALQRFEVAVATTVWSLDDVDIDDEYDLTDEEKREVLSRFGLLVTTGSASATGERLDDLSAKIVAERQSA